MTAIECTLIREGGTYSSTPDGTEYHFAPQADGAHVAFIDNPDHADVFLAIPSAWRLYRGATKSVHAEAKVEAQAAPEADTVTEPVQDEPAPPPSMPSERDDLVAQYTALYGKAPRANASIDKLRELIAAKQ